jgi:DNA-binding response OmpR family regulator
MRVLLITDRGVKEAIRAGLQEEGMAVEAVDDLERADFKLRTRSYEAVLLDQRHLGEPGYGQLLRWRREGVNAHLLVLLPRTAGGVERAACLDAGADACLQHPLSLQELKAHLRALRRRDGGPPSPVRRVHDLEINPAIRSVTRGGRSIHLTPREFDLLSLLASHPGKVLTRSTILQHLYDDQETNYSNVVDVYVRYLRNKIDKGFDTPLILTRWGQGYLLRPEGA